MKCTALKLQDCQFGRQWDEKVHDRWVYDDFLANPDWRKGWISFDCLLCNAIDDRVYCGITSFDADIFRAYDRKTKRFIDIGYGRIADPFDAKFHRALVQHPASGRLYGAAAILHDLDKQWQAPGGAIIEYEPQSGLIKRLATPMPHVYIQSIALDAKRDIIYCQCFPPEYLLSYDLRTGCVHNYGLVGAGYGVLAQGENIALDDDGNLWGCWSLTRAWQSSPGVDACRLFRVQAGSDRVDFLQTGLPRPDGSHGFEKVEGIFNLGDGFMYASGGNGSIYRIDRQDGQATHLCTPIAGWRSRLAALAVGPDGCAYGVTGRDGNCELLRLDFRRDKYRLQGTIKDDRTKENCWQIHDVAFSRDGLLYAGENDNPSRSGYLWEIEL